MVIKQHNSFEIVFLMKAGGVENKTTWSFGVQCESVRAQDFVFLFLTFLTFFLLKCQEILSRLPG